MVLTLLFVIFLHVHVHVGEDFNLIQKEISILSDCKHQNIVGYYSSYLRYYRNE